MLANLIISAVLALSFLQKISAVSSNSEIDIFKRDSGAQPLFPLRKRAGGLRTRDILRRALHPRGEAVFSYGEDFHVHSSQQQVLVVDITLTSHDSTSILLLEDFEDLASSITCSPGSITIVFADSSDFEYTRDAWGSLNGFILISSHPEGSCNPSDERGAYMVEKIYWNALESTVELSAEPLAFRDAGRRMSVDFGHISRESFHKTLTKRQTTASEIADDKEDDTLNLHVNSTVSLKTNLPTRAILWPPLGSSIPVDVGNSGESPVSVQMTCVDCSIDGELLFRGHFDQDFLGSDGIDLELQWAWVEVNVTEPIVTKMKMETYITPQTQEYDLKLLPAPIAFSPFQVPGLFSIGPEFDYHLKIAFGLENAEFNFTYGATIDVPANAIARFDFDQKNNSFSRGWDKTTINQIPFFINSLGGDLAFTFNVTAQPSVGFKISLSTGLEIGPSIDFAAPTLSISVQELQNVTANCTELGPNDYTYYENAFQFSTVWELGVAISVTAAADIPLLPELGSSYSLPLYTHTFAPDKTCKVLGNGTTTGELKLAASVEPQIDIAKVQSEVDKTGVLPTGIDPNQLATYTAAGPLPTSVKKADDAAKGGAASARNMGGVVTLSLLVGVGVVAVML